jgi:RHS repeat-associated protein
VAATGATIGYAYNAFGFLVRRDRQGVPDRYYLWSGGNLSVELDGTDTSRVSEYAYGVQDVGAAPFALVTGRTSIGLTRNVMQDALGSVIGISTGSSVAQRREFDRWGKQTLQTGAVADTNRLRWEALLWEGDSTQLYYARNRWYDPATGRFVSQDPEGVDDAGNQYDFGDDDQVAGEDPLGTHYGPCVGGPCLPGGYFHGSPFFSHQAQSGGFVGTFGGGDGFGGAGGGSSWGDPSRGAASSGGTAVGNGSSPIPMLPTLIGVAEAGDAGGSTTQPARPPVTIWTEKQLEHVYGTRAWANRVKQGTPTSAFFDLPSAVRYTTEAWYSGTPVKGNPNVRDFEFGKPIGVGPRGGYQTAVRVHRNAENLIHGHPRGPEYRW